MNNTGVPSKAQDMYQGSSFDKNSEISEEMDKDVVKYTLQSYVGSHSGTFCEEKKQAAVQKMAKLSKENFDELVGDIINEIHRRCKMTYDEREKPMRCKLTKLREDKFKNLVVDVLHVFNTRYFKDTKSDIQDEITNLGKLISILKVEESTGDEILNEQNEKVKFKLFIEYIKKFHSDKIVEHMESFVDECITSDQDNNFSILFNYKILLQKIDRSKYKKLKEYQIYKSNIHRIEQMNLDSSLKKDLIKKEYLNISDLLLSKQFYFEEASIRNDVNYLINLLTRYSNNNYKDGGRGSISSLDMFCCNVTDVVNKIADKANTIAYINKNIVKKLWESANVKNREDISKSKTSCDKFALDVTTSVRELLENIKK